uniref:Phospholipid-transporting ATPase n=1 Tax=Steinernema glaseri TaxID=37863 RepID=A0A1I7YA57_9BILA
LIPVISSVVWYSTAVPLFFVLAVSAVKDAYDDFQRHRSDRQVNNRISYVVRDGRLVEERWMNVKVGDIVRMENEHFIAADLLLLSTSEPHGLCYIETAELDGETNLKTRSAPPETADMGDIVKQISAFSGHVTCEAPNNRLDTFEGRLEFENKLIPLNNTMMLLRGCRLRNTRWCYGVVVFAGKETKLMMNSGRTKFKRTSLDRFLNVLIMGIVLFLIAMCLICTILCGVWEWSTGRHFTEYLDWDRSVIPNTSEKSGKQIALIALLMFFSYIILLNTVVPISLYVSVEVLRFAHSMFINFDREMYYEKNDVAARARTTTLNEELGQVQYIFSDKTGTLTQNIMTFNKCSINGRSYGDLINDRGEIVEIRATTIPLSFSWNKWHESTFKFYDKTLLEDTRKGLTEVMEFWRLLAICHTVMPERKAGNVLEYQAQSPDEAALTAAARNFGFVFKSRTPQSITIEVNGRDEVRSSVFLRYIFLKRMSVIVKDKHGKLKLYCKGADTMILAKLKRNTSELLRSATMQHLDKFASEGLRTLCCAYKDVNQEYSNEWLNKIKIAASSLIDRQKKMDKLYEEMETDMTLLGATAIEDKLQDGVPETIFKLSNANIKIWVLTGDKMETAINIGYSCRLLTEEMKEIFVINGKEEKEVEVQLKSIKRKLDAVRAQRVGREEPYSQSTFYHLDVDRYITDIISMLDEKEKDKAKSETQEMQYRGFGRRVSRVTFPREAPRLYEERTMGTAGVDSSALSNDVSLGVRPQKTGDGGEGRCERGGPAGDHGADAHRAAAAFAAVCRKPVATLPANTAAAIARARQQRGGKEQLRRRASQLNENVPSGKVVKVKDLKTNANLWKTEWS